MSLTPADVHAKIKEITSEGGIFEMEQVLVDGHAYRAYKHAPKTMVDVLQGARVHGELEFLVYEGRRFTYESFFAAVDGLAASLQLDLGVKKGDRLAIAMRNNPEWLIAFTAGILIGAIVVPINSWGKTEELRYAIEDSGSRFLVSDEARLQLVDDCLDELDITVLVAGPDAARSLGGHVLDFDATVQAGAGREYQVPEIGQEDHCVILYTSGSTGFPKGVLHRQIALTQSLMNMFFLGFLLMELEGAREFKGGAERETPMLTVPLFHATGLLGGFVLPVHTAQKVVMMYKWDSRQALELIQAEKITGLNSVPAVIQDLLKHPDFDDYDTTSLIRVGAAGAATPAGLPELIREKCGEPSRSAGYGMTETMAVTASMSGAVFDLSPDSAGIVSPIVDIRFLNEAGEVVDPQAGGEIELHVVTCMPGYWNKPEANAETFDENRWMKTGDVGRIDEEGFLHITGRIKEIVIRGGENIFPGEIEQAVYEQSEVLEAVVFGVPDEDMGEELALVLHLAPGQSLDEASLRDRLKGRLAGYKVPRHIQFWDHPLPQNASGKLHKLKTREIFLGEG